MRFIAVWGTTEFYHGFFPAGGNSRKWTAG